MLEHWAGVVVYWQGIYCTPHSSYLHAHSPLKPFYLSSLFKLSSLKLARKQAVRLTAFILCSFPCCYLRSTWIFQPYPAFQYRLLIYGTFSRFLIFYPASSIIYRINKNHFCNKCLLPLVLARSANGRGELTKSTTQPQL